MHSRRPCQPLSLLPFLVCLAVLAGAGFAAAAPDRVALVIGNNDYPVEGGKLPPLKNCVPDAQLMKTTLEGLGFTVTYLENASFSEMDDALLRWENNIPKGGTALVYFAGHGIEYEKRNYLMGCNARFLAASRLSQEAMNAETFAIAMLQGGAAHSFLFLDCCREKPSVEWATRGSRTAGGLEDMKIKGDIIIGFAAQPGDFAQDSPVVSGPGVNSENSPYAQALAKWLPSGLKHSDVLQKVREEVHALTEGEQRTWENGSFLKEFYFAEVKKALPAEAPVALPGMTAADLAARDEKIRQLEALVASMAAEKSQTIKEEIDLAALRAELQKMKEQQQTKPSAMTPAAFSGIPAMGRAGAQSLDQGSIGDERKFEIGGGETVTMKYVPAGFFVMGSPATEAGRDQTDDNEDQVNVTLSHHYWMGETEVTQAQWTAVMGTTLADQKATDNADGEITGSGANHPMYFVSWNEAEEYIAKLNARGGLPPGWKWALPTEAQWERACRAGTQTAFSFGDVSTSEEANFDGNSSVGHGNQGPYLETTTPVKSYRPNAYGLYDMHGNVYEWCSDWLGPRLQGGIDPPGPGSGTERLRRGGSWIVYGYFSRSAFRSADPPETRRGILGFRLALVRAE